MSGVDERLGRLSPEKRRLLELRLARERARGEAGAPAGGTVAPPAVRPPPAGPPPGGLGARPLDVSLFFFSADGSSGAERRYDLLLAAAREADGAGFAAVWTPERHFVDFGGLYPNPSVLGAALAVATDRIEIRAGSVVLPLHHPVRVAEEWAVVDNLSGGRAAISCASGWHPSDFALRPGTWEERKEVMFREIETIRRLWRGETVMVTGGDGEPYEVRTLPRPVRAELPIWVTSAGSVETWERAGAAGTHVLAAMGSQPLDDLARKVRRYRAARAAAGHDPASGVVSLMLHTYVGDDPDEIRAKVRGPLSGYLASYMKQRESFVEIPGIDRRDEETLVELAFEHYVANASLLGTPDACMAMAERLAAIGVDELACLVDFGLPAADVLAGLGPLAEVMRRHRERWRAAAAEGGG